MSTRDRQRIRGAMLAAVLIGLTLTGHAMAGGRLPDLVGLVGVALLSVGLAVSLAGRRLRPGPVLVLLLAGQGLAHVVLSLTGHHASSTTSPGAMVAAHLLAAAGATVALVYGDRLVDRWLLLWSTLLGSPTTLLPLPASPSVDVSPTLFGGHIRPVLRHHVVRRGPPTVVRMT